MKAMLASDFLVAKKYLIQQLGICLILGVFMCVVMENLYIIPPMLSVMVSFALTFTILAFDERGNWQQFRLALPLSRTDVVVGRYLCLAAISLIGVAVGLVVMGLMIAAASLLPNIAQLANLLTDFSWQAVLLVSAAGFACALIMLAFILPLVARFGMTKAVRFVPLVIVFGVVGLFSLVDGMNLPQFAANLLAWVQTPEGTVGASAVLIGASLAIYALSGALAVKLYGKREL